MTTRRFLPLALLALLVAGAAQAQSLRRTLVSTGDPATDTAALEAAIASGARDITLDGHQPWRLARTIVLAATGLRVQGVSRWLTVVEWCGNPAQATAFRLRREQDMRLGGLTIRPCRWRTPQETAPTGGAAVVIEPGARPDGSGPEVAPAQTEVSDLWVLDMWDGVHILGANETRLRGLRLRALRGAYGVRMIATRERPIFRVLIEDIVAGPGDLADSDIVWVDQNSHAYSVVLDRARLVRGGAGVRMADDLGAGDSYPMWMIATDLETDHPRRAGALLEAGEGWFCGQCWLSSTTEGSGLVAHRAWRGDLTLHGGRVSGNAGHGVLLAAGRGAAILGALVGDNGTRAPSRYSGIVVGAQARAVTVIGSVVGDLVGVAENAQGWGVTIEPSADEVVVQGNVLTGNRIGALQDEAPGVGRKLTGPNVP